MADQTFILIHFPLYSYCHQYGSKGDSGCYKELRSVKGSLTGKQHFVAQFGRSEDINEIKVCYESVAEICNKYEGFQSVLEVRDKTHDHKADWEELKGTCYKNEVRCGKVIGITGSRVYVSTN
jgi:hypothetical protein